MIVEVVFGAAGGALPGVKAQPRHEAEVQPAATFHPTKGVALARFTHFSAHDALPGQGFRGACGDSTRIVNKVQKVRIRLASHVLFTLSKQVGILSN